MRKSVDGTEIATLCRALLTQSSQTYGMLSANHSVWKGNNMLSFLHSMKLLCQNQPISLAEPCFLENSGKIRPVWRSCLALFLQRPRPPQPLPTSLSPPSCPTSASPPRESALMVTYTWEELPENSNSSQILWWRKEGKISFEQTDISMSWYPGRTQHGN